MYVSENDASLADDAFWFLTRMSPFSVAVQKPVKMLK
jgi:hypothetical protein